MHPLNLTALIPSWATHLVTINQVWIQSWCLDKPVMTENCLRHKRTPHSALSLSGAGP